MRGLGTLINVTAVLLGSGIGVALGARLPARTVDALTDGIGLVVLVVAALSAAVVQDPALHRAVGTGAILVVLAAVVIGGTIGSLAQLEVRLERLGTRLRDRLVRSGRGQARFVEGFVTATLIFVIGPLAILGSISDGLGHGIDQLALKAMLDGVAAVAFAAAFGWGVAASAVAIVAYQGTWTVIGALLGNLLPTAELAALTATGGVLLIGTGLRLLRVRQVPVGDLLPALFVAPLLTWGVAAVLHR
jgi:uncharacterized membrane protein YqgA involved in biofilm formation